MAPKRLYKSEKEKVFFGVCGGLGEYFNIDPVLVRVGFVIITLFTAAVPGIIAYLILAVVMPKPSPSST